MRKSIRHLIEDTFLMIIILLNIFDFAGFLPGDIDYIKKIASWTLVAYLFYSLDISKILFGKSSHDINVLIIISYILLAFRKFTASVDLLAEKSMLFQRFFEFIGLHSSIIEEFTFMAGGLILLLLSVYMARKFGIRKQSLLGIIQESGKPPKQLWGMGIRSITIFIVLSSFFIVLFEYIIEWLAIVTDAPLIMLLIAGYLFYVIRRHKKYNLEKIIYKIGHFGEDFYKRFVSLFNQKKTIFIAVSGILTLHLLIDLATFILPFIIAFFKPVYFGYLDPATHQNIYALLANNLHNAAGIISKAFVILAYLLNTIGIMLLLFLPAFVWYSFFKWKKIKISAIKLGIFLCSVTALIVSPVFRMTKFSDKSIVGVDIQASGIQNPEIAIIAALIVLALVIFLSKISFIKRCFIAFSLGIVNLMVASYAYLYFISNANYFISAITSVIQDGKYLIALQLFVFFGIVMLFYIIALAAYTGISIKEFKKIS